MTNALSFLAEIALNPADEALRLVFADWLEENGDWRSEFVRLDCTLRALPADQPRPSELESRWLELRSRLSPSWLTILGRSEIENCENRFLFKCPERWDNLAPTKVAKMRYCHACRESVYYCHTIEEAREHAKNGHCVAVNVGLPRGPGDLTEDFTDTFSTDEGQLLGLLSDDL
jgi:uncharacterized protein (TIGR02996 family)